MGRPMRGKSIKILVSVVLSLFLTFLLESLKEREIWGEESKGVETIHITADHMESENKKGIINFKGNVTVKRGELAIVSDHLEVQRNGEGRQISKIIATGNVKLHQQGRIAKAERAEYDDRDQTVTLSGNPEALEGGSTVVGKEMILYLKEDRSVVKGDQEQRVIVMFQSQMLKQTKGGTP
ncbi:MAG: lipopolysaccharide transport periplasmic protein LptA [Candidatus Tectomicrobia bacterium]|nr:lipopolysaccharide transport periplasmic protein LptA [Candidatus Tectomicrobia bacterium]